MLFRSDSYYADLSHLPFADENTVRPGSESFILPTRQFADLVISGEQAIEESAWQIHESLRQRALHNL